MIESLQVEDACAAELVRNRIEAGEKPEDTVCRMIEIGGRIIEREGVVSEVDYVRSEFERAGAEVRRAIEEQSRLAREELDRQLGSLFDPEAGHLPATLDGHAEQLAEQISEHFGADRSNAVQNQIKELVAKALSESGRELIRHFSSEDGANPLADFKQAVTTAVTESRRSQEETANRMTERLGKLEQEFVRLTEQAEAKRQIAEAEEAGTRKGLDFEDLISELMEPVVRARGDEIRHTGGETAGVRGKKGDHVIEVGAVDGPAKARIVLEAKDSKLSKTEAWDELNNAMKLREASYAILVVAGDAKVPAKLEPLQEYEGNKLIVAVDKEDPSTLQLEVAYRLARARVLMAQDRELTVDAAGVRDAAESAAAALKRSQSIKRALTDANKGVDAAREHLEAMLKEVSEQLTRIEALIEAAE